MVEILDIGNLTIAELLKPELLNLSKSLKSWDRFKGAWLATEIICGSIGCVTLSSIIWFDQYGCTDKYKTVLTRLTSFAAASVLIGGTVLLTNGLVFMMLVDSMSQLYCDTLFYLIDVYVCFILNVFSFGTLLRYLYIFVWKRIKIMNEGLISIFISILSMGFANLIAGVNLSFGKHRGTMWFICIGGQTQNVERYRQPGDPSALAVPIIVFSVINIILTVRISLKNLSDKRRRNFVIANANVEPEREVTNISKNIKVVNSTNIVDNFTTVLGFFGMCLYAFLVWSLDERGFLEPQWLKNSEGRIVLYSNLLLPQIGATIIGPGLLFVRNKTFRRVILRDFVPRIIKT